MSDFMSLDAYFAESLDAISNMEASRAARAGIAGSEGRGHLAPEPEWRTTPIRPNPARAPSIIRPVRIARKPVAPPKPAPVIQPAPVVEPEVEDDADAPRRPLWCINGEVPKVHHVIREVRNYHGISDGELFGQSRLRRIVWVRQDISFIAYGATNASLSIIAAKLGGKDHTTVVHGIMAKAARIGLPIKGGKASNLKEQIRDEAWLLLMQMVDANYSPRRGTEAGRVAATA